MSVITSIGSNGMTIVDPADQNLIKSTAMSTVTLAATGGTSPYTYTKDYSGTLPAGLVVGASNGEITGTPTTAQGSSNVQFKIVDDDGGAIITGQVSFHVADTLAIAGGLDSATTIEATKSTAWSYTLTNSGGRGPFTWTKVSGTYPAGLSLSSPDITGTPTATGSQVIVFRCTDANGTTVDTANVTILVNDVLAVSAASFTWVEGTIEVDSVVATGGTDPVTWELNATSEFLPDGFARVSDSTNKSAVIFGNIPSGFGSGTNFTLKATDANGATATGILTITVTT